MTDRLAALHHSSLKAGSEDYEAGWDDAIDYAIEEIAAGVTLAATPPDALREAAKRVLSAPLHMKYGPTGEFAPCRCEACAALRAALEGTP